MNTYHILEQKGETSMEKLTKSKCAASLTIRYYVDNLSPERRKYAEVNQ